MREDEAPPRRCARVRFIDALGLLPMNGQPPTEREVSLADLGVALGPWVVLAAWFGVLSQGTRSAGWLRVVLGGVASLSCLWIVVRTIVWIVRRSKPN